MRYSKAQKTNYGDISSNSFMLFKSNTRSRMVDVKIIILDKENTYIFYDRLTWSKLFTNTTRTMIASITNHSNDSINCVCCHNRN